MTDQNVKKPRERGRRANGEGAIYQRKSHGRWVASLDLGWQDGKRNRKVFYGSTKSDVSIKLAEAVTNLNKVERIDYENQTVGQYLTTWPRDSVKPTKAPKTYESYESVVRPHLIPDLGPTKLVKLTPQQVRALLRRKADTDLAASTIHHIRTVLTIALSQAVKWEIIPRNVASLVDSPKPDRTEVEPWNEEEADRFLNVAQHDRLGALFTVAMALGLR